MISSSVRHSDWFADCEGYFRYLSQVAGWDAVTEKVGATKFYIVPMLPYPSGNLHVGHIRNYALCDVLHRHTKAKGLNSLMTMGWDAFGLPAENAATDHNISPANWVESNIRRMKEQMLAVGLAVDWRKEIITSDPNYFRWNQLLFLGLLGADLVHKEASVSNWDPTDKTVLSNEQIVNGRGWRSGSYVQQRRIGSYFLRITNFASELVNNLTDLVWPQHVKAMQKNWVGRHISLGVQSHSNMKFTEEVSTFNWDLTSSGGSGWLSVVTPSDSLTGLLGRHNLLVRAFVELYDRSSTFNPDLSFWKYRGISTGLLAFVPVVQVVSVGWVSCWSGSSSNARRGQVAVTVDAETKEATTFLRSNNLGSLLLASSNGQFLTQADGRSVRRFPNDSHTCSFRIQDWGVSRQRSWGTPIPTRYCQICGIIPFDSTALPCEPAKKEVSPDVCDRCWCEANTEGDTLDTFFDSSWYFFRFPSHDSRTSIIDSRTDYWLPMDTYIGGTEHSVLHLLYSRFVYQALTTVGMLPVGEPIPALVVQGTVISDAFYEKTSEGRVVWLKAEDHQVSQPRLTSREGSRVFAAGKCKMSKSRKNGADPTRLVSVWGSDATRLFILSHSPLAKNLEWNTVGIGSTLRFLNKCSLIGETRPTTKCKGEVTLVASQFSAAIRKAAQDYGSSHYHDISPTLGLILELLSGRLGLQLCEGLRSSMIGKFLGLAFPLVPHLSFKLWRRASCHLRLGTISKAQQFSVSADTSLPVATSLKIQINGKTKREIASSLPTNREGDDVQCSWEALLVVKLMAQKDLGSVSRVIISASRIVNAVTGCCQRRG